MSENYYKLKYTKYKNKYLELKSKQNQVGGYAYAPGQYVFFVPTRMGGIIDSIGSDKIISSLDNFTTSLGNCTRFLRIGTTISGSNKTIYTNQSSFDVAGREAKEAKKVTGEALESAKKTTGEAWEAAKPHLKEAWETTKQTTGKAWDATKQGIETLAKKTKEAQNTQNAQTAQTQGQAGGENDCDKQPIQLPVGLKPFESLNDIKTSALPEYVKLINERQGSEKIGRVIVVEKKGMFGKVFLLNDFVVNYGENNVVTITNK